MSTPINEDGTGGDVWSSWFRVSWPDDYSWRARFVDDLMHRDLVKPIKIDTVRWSPAPVSLAAMRDRIDDVAGPYLDRSAHDRLERIKRDHGHIPVHILSEDMYTGFDHDHYHAWHDDGERIDWSSQYTLTPLAIMSTYSDGVDRSSEDVHRVETALAQDIRRVANAVADALISAEEIERRRAAYRRAELRLRAQPPAPRDLGRAPTHRERRQRDQVRARSHPRKRGRR